MKPLRRVISVTHATAFKLECGHTTYRPPVTAEQLETREGLPSRVGCDICEQEKFRAFDREQAIAKAVREALEGVNQK